MQDFYAVNKVRNDKNALFTTEKDNTKRGDNMIGSLLGKKKKDAAEDIDEYIEVEEAVYKDSESKVDLTVEELRSYDDSAKLQSQIRMGNIIVLKIKELKSKDVDELQRVIDKLKKTVYATGGDIIGIDENIVLLLPPDVELTK